MSDLFVPTNYPAFCRYAVLVNATAAAWRGEPCLLRDTTVIVIVALLSRDNENQLCFLRLLRQGDKPGIAASPRQERAGFLRASQRCH